MLSLWKNWDISLTLDISMEEEHKDLTSVLKHDTEINSDDFYKTPIGVHVMNQVTNMHICIQILDIHMEEDCDMDLNPVPLEEAHSIDLILVF